MPFTEKEPFNETAFTQLCRHCQEKGKAEVFFFFHWFFISTLNSLQASCHCFYNSFENVISHLDERFLNLPRDK
ncbi:hypothetical protein LEP1GSC043_2143 [Leptospira weilii str. Ecochallenge]|uniref:Uncharacterized protein n=1 Tax=Leptospira weilii str. Ecochallenge TaxID=1049986 RepID=N1UDY1_9LEPT|nr:hypothetical protein LEP1GSC043_2143 [Leptospira weilii str. Ecochallenge]